MKNNNRDRRRRIFWSSGNKRIVECPVAFEVKFIDWTIVFGDNRPRISGDLDIATIYSAGLPCRKIDTLELWCLSKCRDK